MFPFCFWLPRYYKAFLTEPSLHAGINSVVFLMAAGHQFETSMQLRQIGAGSFLLASNKGSWGGNSSVYFSGSFPYWKGKIRLKISDVTWKIPSAPQHLCFFFVPGMKLSCILGQKGCLEKMHYWDVGFYLGTSILAGDKDKIIQSSEKLYKLNTPIW